MTLKDIIERIRASTHDNGALDYKDQHLINYVNNGIRFVRRTMLAIDTLLLADTLVGVNELPEETETEEEENPNVIIDNEAGSTEEETEPVDLSVIKIPDGFSNIISVKVNGNTLRPINPRTITDIDMEGDAEFYYAIGFNNICLWPHPTGKVEYTVTYVPDLVVLSDMDAEVPFTSEIIDFIVEYAVIRASMVNEFDVSQETSIMGAIVSQIESLFHNINGHGVQTDGYWGSNKVRRDYGRRY